MNDLQQNHRALHFLVEAVSGYAICMLDLGGRVITWNAGAERLKGYRREEIEGESFSRFFSPEDRRAGLPETLLERARREERVEREGWRIRKDGTRFWAFATLHAVRDDEGRLIGFAEITHDMTEQREMQLALTESEQRFRLLVEAVFDYAIYMLDPSGMIINWNRGAERITGYSANDVIGRHFSIFYAPEDRQADLPAATIATAKDAGRFEAEGWRVRKDGTRFWASVVIDPIYDEEGRHLGFAKITRDISERKAAEEALAESEQQFRTLVLGVTDYGLYMLDPNGIVTNWNAGAQRIKGYLAEEIVGQHFSRFYTEADRSAGVPMRALATAAEQGHYEAEGWRMRKDGSLFWASVVLDAIRGGDGKLIGYAKITRDITDKRNAQLELQRAQEQLAQAQKMEALGQLTGGVAHDFNNLLMVVSGQAQLLRSRLADDPKAMKALDAVELSTRRGEDLTRHLLSFARRQRLQPVPVSLGERAEGLRELLGASVPSTVQVAVDFPATLWPIEADLSELELALLNLTVNGRDAMPEGGVLTISAENCSFTGEEPGGELNGDFVALSVGDTGTGIPADILPRIFDPFFTTKEVSKGTGLGLSQVYGFAQQSGGRVAVESELGQGATFTLYLPRARTAPKAVAPRTEAVETADGAKVLLVEDNPEVAEVAVGMLEELGHEVRVVTSAAAAMRVLHGPGRPDAVLSDIVMAGEMDGVDLARRLRQEAPEVPVLLATGYSQAAERIGNEFPILRKPYKLADLSRALAAVLGRARAHGDKLVPIEAARRARARRRRDDLK